MLCDHGVRRKQADAVSQFIQGFPQGFLRHFRHAENRIEHMCAVIMAAGPRIGPGNQAQDDAVIIPADDIIGIAVNFFPAQPGERLFRGRGADSDVPVH